jgi:hypothetical protein
LFTTTSAATSGSVARLQTVATFDPSQFTELAITLEGLVCNTDTLIVPSLRLDGGASGVALVRTKPRRRRPSGS